jgi:hypothetical protein
MDARGSSTLHLEACLGKGRRKRRKVLGESHPKTAAATETVKRLETRQIT